MDAELSNWSLAEREAGEAHRDGYKWLMDSQGNFFKTTTRVLVRVQPPDRPKQSADERRVLKALNYYGDCCYEYAIQQWGEEGPEQMCSGAKELSTEDEDMLFGEALYAAFAGESWLTPEKSEKLQKLWRKNYMGG